jgi:hypothetical protein
MHGVVAELLAYRVNGLPTSIAFIEGRELDELSRARRVLGVGILRIGSSR